MFVKLLFLHKAFFAKFLMILPSKPLVCEALSDCKRSRAVKTDKVSIVGVVVCKQMNLIKIKRSETVLLYPLPSSMLDSMFTS